MRLRQPAELFGFFFAVVAINLSRPTPVEIERMIATDHRFLNHEKDSIGYENIVMGYSPQVMKFLNGIELEDADSGLLVRQHQKAYIAKGWKLAPSTIELAKTALASGLTWMIRDGHPQAHALWPNGQGRVYLAFSPSEQKQWSVAIDTFNEARKDFGVAVFNGKYHEQFLASNVPFTFEKRNTGAGHMVVQRPDVLPTIRLMENFNHEVLYMRRSEVDLGGFGTEYDIQRSLLQNWKETPFSSEYEVFADEFLVDGGRTSRRIDILARSRRSGDWLVIELKRAQARMEALDQLNGYLLSLGQHDDFIHGALQGVLIAERVPRAVREAAKRSGVGAYEVSYPFRLTRVA